MSLSTRVKRFLDKPAEERGRKIRNRLQRAVGNLKFNWLGNRRQGITFSNYHPDSAWIFADHREFQQLMPQWLRGNARINGGDFARYYSLVLNLKQLLREEVPGDFAELGVYLGNSASVLAHFAARSNRKVLLFDTFQGFDRQDLVGIDAEQQPNFEKTSLERVRANVGHDEHCLYFKGYFPGTITPDAEGRKYAFVHVDCDLYKPMKDALDFFYPRLSPGGMMFLHDYSSGWWPGATQAVDEFCAETGERVLLLPDKSGTAMLRKSADKR